MAIMGQTTTRVDIPHEPGEWMELRDELAPGHLEAAAKLVAKEHMEMRGAMLRTMGADNMGILVDSYRQGVSVQEAAERRKLAAGDVIDVSEQPEAEAEPAPATEPQPVDEKRASFDMDTLAFYFVRDWSYTTANRKGESVPAPITRDRIMALDYVTRGWLHDRAWAASQTSLTAMSEGNS